MRDTNFYFISKQRIPASLDEFRTICYHIGTLHNTSKEVNENDDGGRSDDPNQREAIGGSPEISPGVQ